MRHRVVVAFLLFLSVLTWPLNSAWAESRRVALVVGMSNYQQGPALPNPVDDARALGDALQKLKFEVTGVYDANKRELERALRKFGASSASADIILIFYAGHGVQVDGQNYMIPVDAHLERLDDLPYETIPLGLFMGAIRNAGGAGLMIVDACRNNPFIDKLRKDGNSATKVSSGLGRVDDTPSGTLLAMATRANTVALDGLGEHSPYTQAILEELSVPGVELHLFFGKVSDRVKEITGGKQEPYISGTLGGKSIYLNPKAPNRPPRVTSQSVIVVPDTASALPLNLAQPSDPDSDDQLTITIIALPRGGIVQAGDRALAVGDTFPAADLGRVTMTPDRSVTGDAGQLAYMVNDENGGVAQAVIPITIVATNRSPIVSPPGKLVVRPTRLGIDLPVDPDGDRLSVTVVTVPRAGRVLDNGEVVSAGQALEPEALPKLVYAPDNAAPGPAGRFSYKVDDGHGGVAASSLDISIAKDGSVSSSLTASRKPDVDQLPAVSQNQSPAISQTSELSVTAGGNALFKDCESCPEMISISGGTFAMGSEEGRRNETPVRNVMLKHFAMSTRTVTFGQWRSCAKAGACAAAENPPTGDAQAPVRNISWDDATAYAAWLTAQTGHPYRLLSEAEWEYAARAEAYLRSPAKAAAGSSAVNAALDEDHQDSPGVSVRGIQVSQYSMMDGVGIAEWVQDCWKPSYKGAPDDGSARPGDCSLRVLRGGPPESDQQEITVSSRAFAERSSRKPSYGVRVATEFRE